ncbi:MAG: metallophosphoesterase family protein [Bacteroidota bacterium]|nr:metallophosphoesterase family protein [Bacteroidota bacterium]MEC8257463.1 metallophosphoesterase family protein [Bacteroidota bacterium]
MKKILLLSDTHGHVDDHIMKYVKESDEVWHAGDIGTTQVTDTISNLKPLRAVFGNIDNHELRLSFPDELLFECEDINIYMTHIGGRPGRYSKGISEKIKSLKPKIFICGHSHILKIQFDKVNQLLFINPGAIGKHGFHKVRTMVRFVIDKSDIKNMQVIEVKR